MLFPLIISNVSRQCRLVVCMNVCTVNVCKSAYTVIACISASVWSQILFRVDVKPLLRKNTHHGALITACIWEHMRESVPISVMLWSLLRGHSGQSFHSPLLCNIIFHCDHIRPCQRLEIRLKEDTGKVHFWHF